MMLPWGIWPAICLSTTQGICLPTIPRSFCGVGLVGWGGHYGDWLMRISRKCICEILSMKSAQKIEHIPSPHPFPDTYLYV